MLKSLALQASQPLEVIVIDASDNDDTRNICISRSIKGLISKLEWIRAKKDGAATQRNQGISLASQEAILFVDDDVLFEPDCLVRLWKTLEEDSALGGVSSMIVNQQYKSPGFLSRSLFRILHGTAENSYAGKCIGPALNLLPEDQPWLPLTVRVEWLNTTCTLYRRVALPDPVFSDYFTGYSLLEDVALSLTVGKQWSLANARTARIYHDSQSADHKTNQMALAQMEIVNRHHVMTEVLGKSRTIDYLKLMILESFNLATSLLSTDGWVNLPSRIAGKVTGMAKIAGRY